MRFLLYLALLILLTGCLQEEQNREVDKVTDEMKISAGAFKAEGTIPMEYTCDGSDVSPALNWSGMPDGTKSIALIMDDPDAPVGTFVHWVIYNIPPENKGLPEKVENNRKLDDGSLQGINDFKKIGYNGPCPPPGTPHRYYFKVYAVNATLELSPGATKDELKKALEGKVLAKGVFMGKYGR